MRPKYNTSSCFLIQTFHNMLLESIIGTPLWRCSPYVSPKRITHPLFTIPFFYAVRRICHDNIELLQFIILKYLWTVQSVSLYNQKLIDIMHEHVYSGNGRGNEVKFLSIKLKSPVFFPLFFYMQSTAQ